MDLLSPSTWSLAEISSATTAKAFAHRRADGPLGDFALSGLSYLELPVKSTLSRAPVPLTASLVAVLASTTEMILRMCGAIGEVGGAIGEPQPATFLTRWTQFVL